MSKQKAPRRVAENEALAVGTTIRGSAQKLNLVAGLIRGKKAEEAMNILAFSKKAMARDASKVLASAIATSAPCTITVPAAPLEPFALTCAPFPTLTLWVPSPPIITEPPTPPSAATRPVTLIASPNRVTSPP